MRRFGMAKRQERQTTITLTLAAGRIVDVKSGKGARVTKVNAREIEKISRRGTSLRYVTTVTFTEQDGMCCYYIIIGGRWIKICVPC
jgi:hypothetical protein